MNSRTFVRVIALSLSLSILPGRATAVLETAAPPGSRETQFHQRLAMAIAGLARSREPLLRELHAAVTASRGRIIVRPLTDDPATWSNDGDRDRAHTEPTDRQPKRSGRGQPTDAIVYLNRDALDEGSSHWRGGVLVHELIHALDLSTGRYNRDYQVRERRAVFMQNVWRAHVGYRLRDAYHGNFATMDYQVAIRRGEVDVYARHLFTRADFPAAHSN